MIKVDNYTYYSILNLKNFKFCYLIKNENLKNESKSKLIKSIRSEGSRIGKH